MATHASRNTSTGLTFENYIQLSRTDGLNISKTKLKSFLKEKGLNDPTQYLSWMFQPDEAYYLPDSNEIVIYEKKYQQTSGSADEKLGACAWKIKEYKECFNSIGITKVSYIYIFCDWFKQKRYEKLLNYIRSIDGCDYIFAD